MPERLKGILKMNHIPWVMLHVVAMLIVSFCGQMIVVARRSWNFGKNVAVRVMIFAYFI